MTLPRLLLLTDRAQLPLGRSLLAAVRDCAGAGLRAVVVREHDLAPAARSALIAELASIDGLTVISSRIPDPAAHGLHVASARSGAAEPRQVIARHTLRGRSCHSADEVDRAAADGFDYATLSPFAATASKPGHGPALGPRAYGATWAIPVVALGGIDATNARQALDAGAHGVAVMGAVMRAAEPALAVAELLEAVGR